MLKLYVNCDWLKVTKKEEAVEIFDYAALFQTYQHNTQAERFALNPVITKTSVIVNKPVLIRTSLMNL